MSLEKKLSTFRIFKRRKEVKNFTELGEKINSGLKNIYSSNTKPISQNKSKALVTVGIIVSNANYKGETNYSGESNKY